MTTPDGNDMRANYAQTRITRLQSELERLLEENRRLRQAATELRERTRTITDSNWKMPGE